MNIISIPTKCPGWYDPQMPGFQQPKSWTDCHVRCHVPIVRDPVQEMAIARKKLEAQYPGAILHLIPDLQKISVAADNVNTQGPDTTLLREYLEKLDCLPTNTTIDEVVSYLKRFFPDLGMLGVQGLHFKSVEAWNVLCFEHVKLDLDQKGLTLISGTNSDWPGKSNGSGKSSLVSLPFIALFGKTFKGQTHDAWARHNHKGPAKVELRLALPNGRSLRIVRGRRPALLRVYLDEREVSLGDNNATQGLIERLTNLTWDVLTNAVYIGQRDIGSVFGTDKERKELFSRLLGLDRFLDAQEKLRKIVARYQRSVDDSESEVQAAQAALQESESSLADVERILLEVPKVEKSELADRESEIRLLHLAINKNKDEIQTLEQALNENQEEFEKLLDQTINADNWAKIYQEQIGNCSKVQGRCPTCGQAASVKTLEVHEKGLQTKLKESEAELERLDRLHHQNRTVRKALIEKIQEKKKTIDKDSCRVEALQKETSTIQAQVDSRAKFEVLYRKKEGRVRELQKAKQIHQRALSYYQDQKAFVDFCSKVVGRNGLPAYLCSVVIPQLNIAIARYSQLFTNEEIGISFLANDGDIDLKMNNLHGGASFRDQSAGEMRFAGLIVALAFRDVLVPHSLLVLDEPSDGLDPSNAEAFAQGLNSIVERFQNVFLITHSVHITTVLQPDRHIEVRKQNRVSTIKEVV